MQLKQKFVMTASVAAKVADSVEMDKSVKSALDKFLHNEWGTCSANDSAMNSECYG